MTDNEYFLDSEKKYYKNKNDIIEFNDINVPNGIILNDNDVHTQYSTMFRNITILKNKLDSKLDRNYIFNAEDIEKGPSGYVLVLDKTGTIPYWETPQKVIESLKVNEIIDSELFVLDSGTIDIALFTDISNTTITNKFVFDANGGYFYLKPYTIHKTGMYTIEVNLTPIRLDLIKTASGSIYVNDTSLLGTDMYIADTDIGTIVLENPIISIVDGKSVISTEMPYNIVYKIYVFSLEFNSDIFLTTRNFKLQRINDIQLYNDKLYIKYTPKECNGNKLEFFVKGKKNVVIDKIKITLNTTEMLE